MTERTQDNMSEWVTLENIRTYLETTEREHVAVTQLCVVAGMVRESLGLDDDEYLSCDYTNVELGSDRTKRYFSGDVKGPVGTYIRAIDDKFNGLDPDPIDNQVALEIVTTMLEARENNPS